MLQLQNRTFANSHQFLARTRKEIAEQFAVASCAEHPELLEASVDLENETWDELSFLDYTAAHHAHYETLLDLFPEYRLCMIELGTGEMIATGMCVPLQIAEDVPLPDEGWDWIVDTAVSQKGRNSNVLGALSISVPEQHRHRGFARDMVNSMRALAAMKDLSGVIAPVRPSSKCRFPFVPMEDYLRWKDDRGRIFDPWVRSHVAAGGKIIGVCGKSMVVEQPVEFWSQWTSAAPGPEGPLLVAGALAPVAIDPSNKVGRYVEPNVWVRHGA